MANTIKRIPLVAGDMPMLGADCGALMRFAFVLFRDAEYRGRWR